MTGRARLRGRSFHLVAAALAAATVFLSATLSHAAETAADYPNRPIRLLVPNAPGSSVDTLARIVASRMGEALGGQVVVDNRAGAGGVLGTEIGKNAIPNGYTLVASSSAALAIAPHVHAKLPYDSLRDFEYVSLYGTTPNMLAVHPAQPPRNVKEWVEWVRARGKQLNMASAGSGSQAHLGGALLLMAAKGDSTHVPYKAGGLSTSSVVAGETHWVFTPAPAAMPHVKAGRVRALGHSLPARAPLLGDIPAIAETLPGFEYSSYSGLIAPKGTPRPILNKLYQALTRVIATDDVRDLFAAQGSLVSPSTSDAFVRVTRAHLALAGKVVKAVGLKID